MTRLLSRLLLAWRRRLFEREIARLYPDPYIVCARARKCAHVDGMLCNPRECREFERKM